MNRPLLFNVINSYEQATRIDEERKWHSRQWSKQGVALVCRYINQLKVMKTKW